MIKKLFFTFFLSVLLVLTNSCKKDPINPVDEPETPAKPSISADVSSVKNLQAVLLTVSNTTLVNDVYNAKLGTDSVKLVKVADNQLVFLVPEKIAAGSYNLNWPIAENTLPFHVSELPAIANPDEIVKQYTSNIPSELDKIEAYFDTSAVTVGLDKTALKRDFDRIRKKHQDQLTAYAALSSEDKKTCAAFLVANKDLLEGMQAGTNELMVSLGMKKKADCWSEYLRIDGVTCQNQKLMEQVFLLGAGVGSGIVIGALVGGPIGIGVAGVIVGVVAENQYFAIVAAWEQLAGKTWSLVEVKNWIFNKSTEEFINGQAKELTLDVQLKNIQQNAASNGGLSARMIKLYNDIKSKASFLDMETLPRIKPERMAIVKAETVNYISLSIDNPKVIGKVTGTPGDYKITFSTEEQTEQEFSFEINYSNGEEKIKTPVINAVLKGKTYKVLTSKYETIYILAIFEHDKAQTFYLSEDEKTPAQNIDYSKISIRNQVNNKVEIILTKNASSFSVKMKHAETNDQFVFFDVFYGETKIQEISAKAIKKDPCNGLNVTTTISGKTVTANATGGAAPYSYKILTGIYSSQYFGSSNQLDLITDGEYAVIVKDVNGCVDTSDWGCIDDVVITGVIAKANDKYISEDGILTITWTSSLGLKPDFLYIYPSNTAVLHAYVTNSNHNSFYSPDIDSYCNKTYSFKFGYPSGNVSGTAYSGKYTQMLPGKDGGGSKVTFRLERSCTGERVCPDGSLRQRYWGDEYTISW